MTKTEAIESFVEKRFDAIPQEWVSIVMEKKGDYHRLPVWGTMWFVDKIWGEELMKNSRVMEDYDKTKGQEWNDKNADEEMAGEHCVIDKDGDTTALFVYDIDGEYLVGVNGAGWNFYNGIWDKLYDLLDIQWHDKEE